MTRPKPAPGRERDSLRAEDRLPMAAVAPRVPGVERDLLTQVATLTDSEDEVKATRENEERHLQFEAGGGDGMDMLRQQAFDQAAGGFHRFARRRHQVGHHRFEGAFGIFLAQGDPV